MYKNSIDAKYALDNAELKTTIDIDTDKGITMDFHLNCNFYDDSLYYNLYLTVGDTHEYDAMIEDITSDEVYENMKNIDF